MYRYKELEVVHLEITDKCNAACPQCLRNNNGVGVNPHLSLTELKLQDIKYIFPVEFVKQLKRMYMCGNYGDPIAAHDSLAVFQYFRGHNPEMKLGMNTNGSLRSRDWWQKLAKIFGSRGEVKFGLDGLGDTHAFYRQGTDWKKIIANAQSFISAGGKAVWEFIIFEHNEHQIEEARHLSEKLGFDRFVTKKTWRFFSNVKNQGKDKHEGVGRDGGGIILNKPKSKRNVNPALKNEASLKDKYGSLKEYLNQARIDCKVVKEKGLYVSAEGLALPCCWVANQLYIAYVPKRSTPIWRLIDKAGGIRAINTKLNSLETIINGKFFQSLIPGSWSKPSIEKGKLEVCAKICGSEFDPFGSQYK